MDNISNDLQAEASGVKFPESKGAGVYLRSGRVRKSYCVSLTCKSYNYILFHQIFIVYCVLIIIFYSFNYFQFLTACKFRLFFIILSNCKAHLIMFTMENSLLAIPKFSRDLGRVSNFNQSII